MSASTFEEPFQIAAFMRGFSRLWFVAGGWAIDLYVGHITRPHKDVEIAILRRDQAHLREYLPGWDFQKVANKELHPWPEGNWLELPVHEIHAHKDEGNPSHLEILLNEGDDGEWRFRKNLTITRSISLARLYTPDGIPYLAPEIVLLYKAASQLRRPEDEADFAATLPRLRDEPRRWLKSALASHQPDHPWLEAILHVA